MESLNPRENNQRHIDKGNVIGSLLGGSSKNQYEKFVEKGSHKSGSLRRDYKEVVSAVNLTNPKNTGTRQFWMRMKPFCRSLLLFESEQFQDLELLSAPLGPSW